MGPKVRMEDVKQVFQREFLNGALTFRLMITPLVSSTDNFAIDSVMNKAISGDDFSYRNWPKCTKEEGYDYLVREGCVEECPHLYYPDVVVLAMWQIIYSMRSKSRERR